MLNKRYVSSILVLAFIVNLFTLFPVAQTMENSVSLGSAKDVKLFIGNTYQGFTLKEIIPLEVKSSKLHVFEHNKTKAQLVFLKNNDENKTFSITFRTPPTNSKGIQHITEHMVLDGSEKYPVKNIFFNILYGSTLATFMNAMTYPVFTTFPIASTNTADFNNLMGVYLDSVFNPLLKQNENIFLMEGIRKEINQESLDLNYNGIVYNEMKASLGNSDWISYTAPLETLLPDTPYAYEAGGKPEEIETLTYPELMDYYSKYYHPSNSLTYLYGDMDIIGTLKFINDNYFSKYEKKNYEKTNYKQASFHEELEATYKYAVEEGTDLENKYIFSLAYVANDYSDYKGAVNLQLLADILNSSGSLLEKSLLEAGISTNYHVTFDTFPKQNILTFSLYDASLKDKKIFKEIVKTVMTSMVEDGIDVKLANSILDSIALNQAIDSLSVDSGINYLVYVAMNWLYDAPYTQNINTKKDYDNLRRSLNSQSLGDIVKEYILNNKHSAFIILEPSTTYTSEWQEKSDKRLAAYKSTMTTEDILTLKKETEEFNIFMNTPNGPEELSTIPTVPLSALNKDVDKTIISEKELNSVKILRSDKETENLLHLNYIFKGSQVPQEKIMHLSLVMDLLGKLNTKNYKVNDLESELFSKAQVNFENKAFVNEDFQEEYKVKNVVSLNLLSEDLEYVNGLITEILYNTDFNDIDRLKQKLAELKSSYESNDPRNFLLSQLKGYVGNGYGYGAQSRGLSYYSFIKEIEEQLTSEPDKAIADLKAVYAIAFPKEDFIINTLGTESNNNYAESKLIAFANGLKSFKSEENTYDFKFDIGEAFKSNIPVQYNGFITDYSKLGYKYSGKLEVLEQIINEYLGEQIRSKNGAYDSGINIDKESIYAYSYRDPELAKTYEVFKSIPEYIESLKLTDSKLEGYIISAYRDINPLLNSIDTNDEYLKYALNGTNPEKNRIIEELLSTSAKDINDFSQMLRDVVDNCATAAIGNSSTIEENAELFKYIKNYLD